MKTPRPPAAARALLRLWPLGADRAEIESNLEELWELRVRAHGAREARRRYYRDVISLWRSVRSYHRGSTTMKPQAHAFAEIARDLVYGARLFRRNAAVMGIAVAGLGLAIGVGTTVFSVVNATALKSVGIIEPRAVVRVLRGFDHRHSSTSWPYHDFVRLRQAAANITLEAATSETAVFATRPDAESDETAYPMFVSGGFFDVLNNRVTLGRPLARFDDSEGAAAVVVLSHAFWSRRLGADPSIIGRSIWLNGARFTVVGVAVRGFTGTTDTAPSLWAPVSTYHLVLGGPAVDRAPNATVHVVGRIAAGASKEQAEAGLRVTASAIGAAMSDPRRERLTSVRFTAADRRFNPNEAAFVALAVTIVMIVIALVVLLACVNVANLLLASAVSRQRELSVRVALGASRARIVRQLLVESLALGVAGGAIGLLMTIWLIPLLARFSNAPASVDLSPDATVYTFLTGLSLLAGIGAGLVPARHVQRHDLTTMLKGIGLKADGTAAPRRFRSTFIALQAGASVVLLVLAALLTRGMLRAAHVDIGFDADHILTISGVFGKDTHNAVAAGAYWNAALERARTVPGVASATLSTHAPFGSTSSVSIFRRAGHSYTVFHHRTRDDYFATLKLRVVRGRLFTADEVRDGAQVVVISETLARDLYAAEDPIGQSIDRVVEGSRRVIIGVVGDTITARVRALAYASIYYPFDAPLDAKMIVRSSGAPEALIPSLRSALHSLDSSVRLTMEPANQGLQRELAEPRSLAAVTTVIADLALALAVIGIFGVTSFVVRQRTQEIGVRIACGANARDVVHLLVADGLRPIGVGLAGGLVIALGASRVLAGALYGLSAMDPVAFGGALVILSSAAFMAILFPARRAAKADAASVLREL